MEPDSEVSTTRYDSIAPQGSFDHSDASPAACRARWWPRRRWIFWLPIFLIVFASLRLTLLSGWVRPLRVVGGSMAPTLLGPHFACACDDCGLRWSFDALQSNALDRLICPNCGYRSSGTAEQLPVNRGDRLLLDKGAYLFVPPRPGDLVLFREKTPRATSLAVKRLVGLPGEQISIQEGDLYRDGVILRKTLSELRSLAILVHDDRFAPRSVGLPARWLPEEDPSWISYRNWRCYDSAFPRADETQMLDNDGYNQGTSRQLQHVFDLMLTGQADFSDADLLQMRGHNGFGWYTLLADATRQTLTLHHSDALVAQVSYNRPRSDWNGRWEFALFDRQFRLAVNGQELLGHNLPKGPVGRSFRKALLRPFAIRQSSRHVMLLERQVFRDIHYLHPHGGTQLWQSPRLGPKEFLVLGDNVPISADSRESGRTLHRNDLLGKVLWSWSD